VIRPEIALLVLGMGLVTYLPRWLPVFFFSRRPLPPWFIEWLDLIPVAILSALIFGDLFISPGPARFVPLNAKSLVAVPTFLFALRTKSLSGTVILGMLLFWLAEAVF
jgi:branched-subunit amino acid transport protein